MRCAFNSLLHSSSSTSTPTSSNLLEDGASAGAQARESDLRAVTTASKASGCDCRRSWTGRSGTKFDESTLQDTFVTCCSGAMSPEGGAYGKAQTWAMAPA